MQFLLSIIYERMRTMRLLWHKLFQSSFGLAVLPLLLLLLIGTVGYAWLEGWSLVDALYATVITITTVGYGDFLAGLTHRDEPLVLLFHRLRGPAPVGRPRRQTGDEQHQ